MTESWNTQGESLSKARENTQNKREDSAFSEILLIPLLGNNLKETCLKLLKTQEMG